MSELYSAVIAALCTWAACDVWYNRKKQRKICEMAVIDAFLRMKRMERWVPPGNGFQSEGTSHVTIFGEPFEIAVRRRVVREREDA